MGTDLEFSFKLWRGEKLKARKKRKNVVNIFYWLKFGDAVFNLEVIFWTKILTLSHCKVLRKQATDQSGKLALQTITYCRNLDRNRCIQRWQAFLRLSWVFCILQRTEKATKGLFLDFWSLRYFISKYLFDTIDKNA